MSITLQNLLPNTHSRHHHHNICFYSTRHIHHSPPKTPLFTHSNFPNHSTIPPHLKILSHPKPFTTLKLPLRVFESDGVVRNQAPNEFSLDNLLSIAEFLCLAPSAALSIGWALNWAFFSSQKWVQVPLMNKIIVVQVVLLVGAVGFAALIRRRQWKRICLNSGNSGSSSLNLVERIEKLEEDLRSSATIIRVLSRQVEKLGVRFRVTRKTLKEPISETAALAQKNSEATRALAAQEDNLEKELGEIQKVLLAMQEQQSKQLELILAIGKAGKLRDILREPVAEKEINRVPKSSPDNNGAKQMKTQSQTESIHQGANDKP